MCALQIEKKKIKKAPHCSEAFDSEMEVLKGVGKCETLTGLIKLSVTVAMLSEILCPTYKR